MSRKAIVLNTQAVHSTPFLSRLDGIFDELMTMITYRH